MTSEDSNLSQSIFHNFVEKVTKRWVRKDKNMPKRKQYFSPSRRSCSRHVPNIFHKSSSDSISSVSWLEDLDSIWRKIPQKSRFQIYGSWKSKGWHQSLNVILAGGVVQWSSSLMLTVQIMPGFVVVRCLSHTRLAIGEEVGIDIITPWPRWLNSLEQRKVLLKSFTAD